MVTISSGGLGSEKGFMLIGVDPIDTDEVVAGGATSYASIASPGAYESVELLSLAVYANQVPGAIPDLFIDYTLGAFTRRGKAISLVQGEDTQTHELDIVGTRALKVYRHGFTVEAMVLFLTAHAVNETTFSIGGTIARYRMPT